MKLFQSVAAVLAAPFRWGYEVVDTHPPGSAYRRIAKELHAVDTGSEGEIAFVVGHGLTERMPVMEMVKASTPAEAANATLQMVGHLRRSQARAIHREHKVLVSEKRNADKAAQGVPEGNVRQDSPGNPTPSSDVSGPAGEVLMPA